MGLRLAWLRSRFRSGVIAGVAVALWCNTLFLAIPYLGAYPNLLTGLIGSAVSGGANQGPSYFLPTMLANLLLWPLFLWTVFRRKRKKLGLCLKCGYDLRGSKERCPECENAIREP